MSTDDQMAIAWWLDEQHPHDEEISAAQIAGIQNHLGDSPKRVLDLGCGEGRMLLPIAQAGHQVLGIDHDADALDVCRSSLAASTSAAELIASDFITSPIPGSGLFDCVLCLGNTVMTIVDVDQMVDLMSRVRAALKRGGAFIIDDCPRDFWPELAEGNWQSGISEEGDMQLVWDKSDAVFALRVGDQIDEDAEQPGLNDRRYRLWTDGALRLAARAAGLSAPARKDGSHLLIMRASEEARTDEAGN